MFRDCVPCIMGRDLHSVAKNQIGKAEKSRSEQGDSRWGVDPNQMIYSMARMKVR